MTTPPPKQQASSFLHTVKAVAWSFVGLRQSDNHLADAKKINPLHLIAIGIGLCFAFVVGMMFFVQWVVAIPK